MGRVNRQVALLTVALLTIGFTATASQVLILRELVVVFHGNELFLGVILGTWLFLEAVGCYFSRRRADGSGTPGVAFVTLQFLIGLAPLVSILIIRSFKYVLAIPVGEFLGIQHVALVSLVALAPPCVLDGAIFPFGSRTLADLVTRGEAPGRVYLAQSLGAFAAGVAYVVYFLRYLNPIQLSLILFLMNLCSVVVLLRSVGAPAGLRHASSGILAMTAITLLSPGPAWLDRKSAELQWYEYSLLGTRQSIYSHLAVIGDREQYTFFANGIPYATTPTPEAQIEEFVHFPLLSHPRPERVLVIGGGAGGVLGEILKHPVTAIDYAEQDPLIVDQFRRFPTPLTEYELSHPRIRIHPVEGRLFLRTTAEAYDVILLNLPAASTLSLNRFYTVEFHGLARGRLREKGIFGLRLPGSETLLSRELEQLNGRMYASLKAVFAHVKVVIGDQNIVMASDDPGMMSIGQEVLIERQGSRGIAPGLMNEGYIRYKTDPRRFRGLEEKIIGHGETALNRDGDPKGVIDGLVFLSSTVSPFMAGLLGAVSRLPARIYWIGLPLFIGGLVAIQVWQRNQLYLSYAVASTGLTSMLLSVLLILAFQIYYGYVYHHIALLTSLFMLGSGVGAWWGLKHRRMPLLWIELGMVLLTLITYCAIAFGPSAPRAQVVIFALMFLAGLSTGLEFPVAVDLADRSYRWVGSTAGGLYAVDLAGAVLGAVLTAVLWIPGIGLGETILLAGLIKTGGVILVYCASYAGADRARVSRMVG